MIHLRTLGVADLRDADGRSLDAVLTQPKRLALLIHLAIGGPGYRRRDTLLDLLWRDSDQAHARAALNQSIYFLRRELGREVILSRGKEEVAVEQACIRCDVTALDAALEAGDRQAAVELYRGELLPGFFLSDAPGWERWLDRERDRLRARAAAAARELADEALGQGAAAEAVRWARRAGEIVPDDETHVRRLLTLLAQAGDRAGAAKAYVEAEARFAAEYDCELSPRTRSLMDRIRAGDVEDTDLAEERPVGSAADPAPSPGRTSPVAVARAAAVAPADPPPGRRWWTGLTLAVAAMLFVVGALRWTEARWLPDGTESAASSRPVGDSVAPERLAVLPLVGLDLDADYAYLADALTLSFIGRLSDVTGLGVVSWSSVEPYRWTRPSSAEIGERIGARYLVEGSLARFDQEIRLDMRLVESATGRTLWSDRHHAPAEHLAAIGGEVAVDITRALALELGEAELERLRDPGPDDPAARSAYLEGRYLLGKSDEGSVQAALDRFRVAVDRDPTYALAWSGLSDAYDHLAGLGAIPSDEAYPRARSAAERALELDPDLPEAHSSLAMALSHHYWMSEDAERHWRRALELNPSDARARRTYAGHLRNLGRFDEALAHATVARDLDPIPFWSHFEILVLFYFQRRHEEVVEMASELAAADPTYAYAHFLKALALVQLDRETEALAALAALDPDETFPDAQLIRGYVAARAGDREPARGELRRLEAAEDAGSTGFQRAILYIALGEHDRAMAALEEAHDVRQFRLRLLGYEPLFDPLRNDARFRELLGRIGLAGARWLGERDG